MFRVPLLHISHSTCFILQSTFPFIHGPKLIHHAEWDKWPLLSLFSIWTWKRYWYCSFVISYMRGSTQHPCMALEKTSNCTSVSDSNAGRIDTRSPPHQWEAPIGSMQANPSLTSSYKHIIKPVSIEKHKQLDNHLVQMVTKEYHPFSLV